MSNAKRNCAAGLTALFAIILLLQACASVAYLPGQQTIGRLRTIGPNVLLNHKPARDGLMVTTKDHVSTGSDSSAYIHFLDTGYTQFDENTEPTFDIAWDGTNCSILIVGILVGQAYEETGRQCRSLLRSPHGEWTQQERQFNIFNIRVDNQKSVLTVLDGQIALSKPKSVVLQPGQQITVSSSGIEEVKTLSEQELLEVTRWRHKFPPCTPDACFAVGGAASAGQCTD